MIELKKTKSMGLGVFATRTIFPKTRLDRNSAIPFTPQDWKGIKQTMLGPVVFMDKKTYKPGKPCKGYMVLGDISRVNHGEPNAEVEIQEKDKDGIIWAHLIARKAMKRGDQVFIAYTNLDDDKLYPFH